VRTHPIRHSALGLLFALSAGACGGSDRPAASPPVAATTATAASPAAPVHSIDLTALDRSVSPGNDFFLYANGAWLKSAQIPADRASAGIALDLQQELEKRTRAIVEEAAQAPAGSELRKVGDYYGAFLDEPAIESRGLEPLKATLDAIGKVGDARALSALLGGGLRADVDPLNNTSFHTANVLGLWVDQDLNDTSRYAPYLLQGGLGMPDRSYYLDETAPMAALRAKYVAHLAATLRLAGIADSDAKAARVFAFEKKLASSHATRQESEDVAHANNVWKRTEFATRAPGMDWEAFFAAAGLEKQPSFIVWHPHAMTGLGALVKGETLQTWKDYLTVRALERSAWFLPKAFVEEDFAFYEKALRGTPAPPPRWRRGLTVTNDALGEAVGKAYVGRFFPPESKKAVEGMVASLLAAFSRRIDGLEWMAPATKAKAKEKLKTLRVGIGYPDKWRDYSALAVVRGDALGNVERAELFEYGRNVAKLGSPVDRGEWAMVPQIVNAVNLPIRNALNFPAGILQPPFFDPRASSAANYGGIGVTIGHEISHSFDDQGAKFDALGRYENWWTPEDLARFESSGAALAAQFSAYKPLPDLAVNGKQTLGENIADLAGMAVAYDAWRTSLGGKAAPVEDEFTGDQQFFLASAQGWRDKERDELVRRRIATDGHAPPHYRVLTVRNLDAWYEAFGVKEGEALFLKPAERVRVW
jgi:putative endopeptidase